MSSTGAQAGFSTPTKSTPNNAVTDSPGTWRHPRLQEITRRREAATFTEKNMRRIVINVTVMIAVIIVQSYVKKLLPSKRSAPQVWDYFNLGTYALFALPLYNIAINLLPLIRAKDDLSDIALTPAQRKLLGLPPSSAPPTPGSVYSTPPRYSRTPSASGSPASRRSFSSSPGSNRSVSNPGTPTPAGNGTGGLMSPLLQKAMLGARRSSLGSLGSPSPKASISSISTGSIFGNGPESPSPSPIGKRSSVGLNSKWRYDRSMYDKTRSFRDSASTDSAYT
ncbi:NPCC-domain-containing protein [Poronia punctata]|nr:NPCC-domain-containing protein [Poronia punctata]